MQLYHKLQHRHDKNNIHEPLSIKICSQEMQILHKMIREREGKGRRTGRSCRGSRRGGSSRKGPWQRFPRRRRRAASPTTPSPPPWTVAPWNGYAMSTACAQLRKESKSLLFLFPSNQAAASFFKGKSWVDRFARMGSLESEEKKKEKKDPNSDTFVLTLVDFKSS